MKLQVNSNLVSQALSSPITEKCQGGQGVCTSFIHWRSSMICKMLPKDPHKAVEVLKHVWDQEFKDVRKKALMEKYWKRDNNKLGEVLLEIGKNRACKNETKLSQLINKLKTKYNSIRQVCKLGEISWTKFHRHIYIRKNNTVKKKLDFKKKLTSAQIDDIKSHYESEEISFPLPDKKYVGKRFMCTGLAKAHKMYNLLPSTTHKISACTFHKYKPKDIKFKAKYHLGRVAVKSVRTLKTL